MSQRRLLWQIYPAYLLVIIVALLIMTGYLSQLLRDFYYSQVKNDLEARARLVEQQIKPMLEQLDFDGISELSNTLGRSSSTRITIIMPDGRVIADSEKNPADMENHNDRPEIIESLEKGVGNSLRPSDTLGIRMMYLAIPLQQQGETLAIVRTAIPATAIDRQLNSIYNKILLSVVVIAIVAAGVSLFMSRRISEPIEQMKDTAQRFAAGDLELRVSMPKQLELAELAVALNEMAQQLKSRIDTITRQRNESEAILSSMIEGVLAVDSEGHIVRINKAAAHLFSIDQTNIQGRTVEESIRNPDLQKFVQDILNKAQPHQTEITLSDSIERIVRLDGAVLTDSEGKRSGAVIVISDMTRIHHLENLRRDFVANVSHELRTPITSIKGFLETLQEGAIKEPQEAKRFLEIIARHSDRLNAIVEDLLTLSNLEESNGQRQVNFKKEYIKDVLNSVIEFTAIKAEQKKIAITLDCDKDIRANINKVLLEQAILNLVDNAIKYSRPKGKVEIAVHKSDERIAVSVRDYGCGIDRKHQERIFERFYVVDKSRSRKLGGTGLGLAIVKHIAEVHGGNVIIQSTVGSGSTFTINLPVN